MSLIFNSVPTRLLVSMGALALMIHRSRSYATTLQGDRFRSTRFSANIRSFSKIHPSGPPSPTKTAAVAPPLRDPMFNQDQIQLKCLNLKVNLRRSKKCCRFSKESKMQQQVLMPTRMLHQALPLLIGCTESTQLWVITDRRDPV